MRKGMRIFTSFMLVLLLSTIGLRLLPYAYAETSEISEPSLQASLSGASKVQAGQAFTLGYGLKQVTGQIYAQDLTISYDPETVEFIAAESIREGVSIVGQTELPGRVRILTASHGEEHALDKDGEWLVLRWSTKLLPHAVSAEISVSDAVVSSGDGVERQVSSTTHTFQVVLPIQDGDLNGDHHYTIGDLAIAAVSYGKSVIDPDWNKHARADVNGDGRVDIEDLAIIARAIFGGGMPGAPIWAADKQLSVSDVTSSSLTLTWPEAIDPVGVTGYKVYLRDQVIATVTERVYKATSLAPNTTYLFKVEAGNAAGRWSSDGPSVTVTTKQASEQPPVDVNGDNKISIGDLAITADAYGRSEADPNWERYKRADVNRDGRVDIEDLALIARAILSEG